MFSVVFEVQPGPDQWDAYLAIGKMLRPELERVDGFVDNVRYASLTRPGWLLSLSNWRDEKSVVRWRTTMRHHMAQERGRTDVLRDYHLRVGEVTRDTRVPRGHVLVEHRLDETEVGEATAIVLIDAQRPATWVDGLEPVACVEHLGLDVGAAGLIGWDVFDAVLTPGDLVMLTSWRTQADAKAFEREVKPPGDARVRSVRVVRDYGMMDRREAPQYYPPQSPQAKTA
jgi:heme-degrading monooxygenase HmoA